MAITVSKTGTVIVAMLDTELRAAGVAMTDPASSVAWNSKLRLVTVNAPAATSEQLALIPGVVAAHTGATPVGTFVQSHTANLKTFVKALYQLEQGINGHTTAGANLLIDYQAALSAAMNVVNTLPQPYLDNLNAERDLQNVAVAVGSMTITQARTFAILLRAWLNTRVAYGMMGTVLLD
jgi:hypothetical protein